jgi:hypothetical protein
MTKYNVLGGGHIEATTDLGIIEALREYSAAWIPTVSIEDFMEGMAQRCQIQTGDVVRTDSITHFVADLKQFAFITQAES